MFFLEKFHQNLFQNIRAKKFFFLIAICFVIFLITNIILLYIEINSHTNNPIDIIGLLLLIATSLFFFLIYFFNIKIPSNLFFIKKDKKRILKLRKRIITAFTLGTTIPTIVVAIFSIYFFYFSVQSWFDSKISKVLEQSVFVGESYIDEHVNQLKDISISISQDLNSIYYDLIGDPVYFKKFLDAQAEIRSLNEAIVFKKDTHIILAKTAFSFSLSFLTIPEYIFKKVDNGEIVRIESDPTKIRVLIKLRDYSDTYLLIGRVIDNKIINHIDQTNGTAQEYFNLKKDIFSLQIKFLMIFVLFAISLTLFAIIWGRRFAERIVKPIKKLVIAAEKVKNGDYTVQVPEHNLRKDEVKILSSVFNRMVKQIDRQRHDLVVAQRAMAWSDVARRVAHEIKNPLTPIKLSAERLLKKFTNDVDDQEVFKKYLNNIIRHSDDIKIIVSEFVNFARLPSPKFAICEIISMINTIIDARRLINEDIVYQVKSNVKSFDFVCDSAQISRIIVNLVQNSEDAMIINKKQKTIQIEIEVNDKFFNIAILDNGPGFNKNILKNAVQSYFTTKEKGMGLGLAIVDRIVQDHFGALKISNRNNGGALIRLIFDVQELKMQLK